MAIPSQTQMNEIVLSLMSDGAPHSRRELRGLAAAKCGLSEEDMAQTTSSGVYVYVSRTEWAVSNLSAARLLRCESKGVYTITQDGKDALAQGTTLDVIRAHSNAKAAERKALKRARPEDGEDQCNAALAAAETDDALAADLSPQESIERAVEELNEVLADELVGRILQQEPAFFERLVVRLLEAMGYGAGTVTQQSADGGVDGFVSTDELGFNPIYTQAKRYTDKVVGRPEVQAFAGALNGSPNGVFITTSTFSKEAVRFAQGCKTATIALIDGRKLGELMIKYNVGVFTSSTVEIKKIDTDFFES